MHRITKVVAGLAVLGVLIIAGAWLVTVLFAYTDGDPSAQLGQPVDQKLIDRGV